MHEGLVMRRKVFEPDYLVQFKPTLVRGSAEVRSVREAKSGERRAILKVPSGSTRNLMPHEEAERKQK